MIDSAAISHIFGLIAVFIVLMGIGYKMHKKKIKFSIKLFAELIMAYLSGMIIYPGIQFMGYPFSLDAACSQIMPYKTYLGLAGVVLVFAGFYMITELIINKRR